MAENKLFITGAAGLIGSVLREGLRGTFAFTGVDRRPGRGDREVKRLDVSKIRTLSKRLRGHDVVIDLASAARADVPWQVVYSNNLTAAYGVLEAARLAGVRRVIHASTNRVTGMYEREEPYASILRGRRDMAPDSFRRINVNSPIRPDGLYAVAKAFAEGLGRYYSDEYGLSVICIRIGSVLEDDRPHSPRHLSTLLSHRDLLQLVRRSIEAPDDLRFAIFYGVSANTWRIWDIENVRDLIGYEPEDDAETLGGHIQ